MIANNIKELKDFLISGGFSAEDLVVVEDGNIKVLKRSTAISVISLLQFISDIDNDNYKIFIPIDGVLVIIDNMDNEYPICINNNIEGIKDANSNKYIAYDYVEKDNGNEISRIRLWSSDQINDKL